MNTVRFTAGSQWRGSTVVVERAESVAEACIGEAGDQSVPETDEAILFVLLHRIENGQGGCITKELLDDLKRDDEDTWKKSKAQTVAAVLRTYGIRPKWTGGRRTYRFVTAELRRIPLDHKPELLEALRHGRPVGPDNPVFLFIPTRPTWERDLRRAGIPKVVPIGNDDPRMGRADRNCLRTTFESHLQRAGVDLSVVSFLMRHPPRRGMRLTVETYGDRTAR